MPLRLMLQGEILYDGEAVPVPRVGDGIERDGRESLPVVAVTWKFTDGDLVVVTLEIGDRPYTY